MENTKKILKRMVSKLGFSTNKQLANYLGISYSTLNSWLRRKSIPLKVINKIVEEKKINYDWLLTGQGENSTKSFINNKNISISGNNKNVSVGNYLEKDNNVMLTSDKKKISDINITEDDLEMLKYFKRLSSKKQEYYFYLIKADVLKEEIDNNFK